MGPCGKLTRGLPPPPPTPTPTPQGPGSAWGSEHSLECSAGKPTAVESGGRKDRPGLDWCPGVRPGFPPAPLCPCRGASGGGLCGRTDRRKAGPQRTVGRGRAACGRGTPDSAPWEAAPRGLALDRRE